MGVVWECNGGINSFLVEGKMKKLLIGLGIVGILAVTGYYIYSQTADIKIYKTAWVIFPTIGTGDIPRAFDIGEINPMTGRKMTITAFVDTSFQPDFKGITLTSWTSPYNSMTKFVCIVKINQNFYYQLTSTAGINCMGVAPNAISFSQQGVPNCVGKANIQ